MLDIDAGEEGLPSGGGGKADEGAGLHIVAAEAEGAAVQALLPLDAQAVGADAIDGAAHQGQHRAQVLHVGLTCGVGDDRLPACEGGGHDDILGCGHRCLIEEEVRARQRQPVGGHRNLALLDCKGGAEGREAPEVGIQTPETDDIAPRGGEPRLADGGQEGAEEQDGATDRLDQGALELPAPVSARDRIGVGPDQRDGGAQVLEQGNHHLHILDVGDI